MIDFSLTDEQNGGARDGARLRREGDPSRRLGVRPRRHVASGGDREGVGGRPDVPHVPEEYGGVGASFMDGVLLQEELGWGCSGMGTSISCNGLASAPVLLGGSEQVKKTYLGMLTEAPKLASFCLTEPDAGSDVSGMRTTATRHGDKYVINGSKCFITNGGYADWFTVYAKTDKEAGHRGSPASSSPATRRSRWTRRRTRWASGPPTPRPSPSTTPRSPPTT